MNTSKDSDLVTHGKMLEEVRELLDRFLFVVENQEEKIVHHLSSDSANSSLSYISQENIVNWIQDVHDEYFL